MYACTLITNICSQKQYIGVRLGMSGSDIYLKTKKQTSPIGLYSVEEKKCHVGH